jgi:hypothetical protein
VGQIDAWGDLKVKRALHTRKLKLVKLCIRRIRSVPAMIEAKRLEEGVKNFHRTSTYCPLMAVLQRQGLVTPPRNNKPYKRLKQSHPFDPPIKPILLRIS